MIRKYVLATAIAAVAVTTFAASPALAAKIEKVDVVKEGIDMTPVVVKANSNGYTGYQTSSHTYLIRVFAKGKGSNIYWNAISNSKNAHPMTLHTLFYRHASPIGTVGWGVYKTSLKVSMDVEKTAWLTTPKAVCAGNLADQMAKGKSKADVLKKEWKLMAYAGIYYIAAADSKSNNKKGNHKINKIAVKNKGILYPVAVTCKKGM